MTQEELDAIPECGGIGYIEHVVNGRVVRVPYTQMELALAEPSTIIMDSAGNCWMIGWANGIRYKRRV